MRSSLTEQAERPEARRLWSFALELEAWITTVLPPDGPLENGADGLSLGQQRIEEDGRIAINGFIWRIDTQTLYPFEVRLKVGADKVENYEVRFGDPAYPDGGAPKYFQVGEAREWMFTVSEP